MRLETPTDKVWTAFDHATLLRLPEGEFLAVYWHRSGHRLRLALHERSAGDWSRAPYGDRMFVGGGLQDALSSLGLGTPRQQNGHFDATECVDARAPQGWHMDALPDPVKVVEGRRRRGRSGFFAGIG